MSINIAIDGPAGAGKSTIARLAAAKLSYIYVDSGAMYRAVALFVIESKVDPSDAEAVASVVKGANISIKYVDGEQKVILNGRDVSGMIRTPEVSAAASQVSAVPAVRAQRCSTN